MNDPCKIDVTRTSKGWYVRLSVNAKPWVQTHVNEREHTGLAAQELLRTYSKMGALMPHSPMAESSRKRQKNKLDIPFKFEWL